MAGTTVPEIYCWNLKIEDLNIYLASSKRGALRVGLSLREKQDSATFFRKRFPNTRLVENYPLNKPLMQAVQAALLNKPFKSTVDFDFSHSEGSNSFTSPRQPTRYSKSCRRPSHRS